MGTDSDFYDSYKWFYPNAHKMVLYQFFFMLGGKLEIRNFKEQFVLKICNNYKKFVIVGSYAMVRSIVF